jgi:RNA polymerase sigma-70 factor (ECF subfamily)
MLTSDKSEFVELVYENIQIIYKICSIYSHRHDKDLQQEIIFQLWKSYPQFKKQSKFQTWMYRVALNTALLRYRKKRIRISELKETDILIEEETESDEDAEQVKLLYMHISKLNKIERAVIFLYLEQCSYQEIGKITGLSAKNVSVKLVRIREKLRKMFQLSKI